MTQRKHGTQSAQTLPSLSGVYTVAGFMGRSLRRLDGLTLSVQDTRRRTLGPGDAARYVSITTGLNSEYAGNLYGPCGLSDARATEDLDGCQFQHRSTGVRYCIKATADGYELSPVTQAGASR